MIKDQLKILFITDIHLSFSNAQKLTKWHEKTKISFDYILVGGDTANCDQNDKTHDEAQQFSQANKILILIQEFFCCKMYFIPGNHDPLKYYQKGYLISDQIQSVHERTIKITEGLEIVGFGGSVPGYLDKEATKQIWKGYPFLSNDMLAQYCEEHKIFSQQNSFQNQRIYLTHCGPFDYETSISRMQINSPIYGGAKYLNSLIEHKNLLVYFHGHVHAGSRYARVNEVPIINPGNLSGGEFGYFVFERNQEKNLWKIQEKHFVQL